MCNNSGKMEKSRMKMTRCHLSPSISQSFRLNYYKLVTCKIDVLGISKFFSLTWVVWSYKTFMSLLV